MSIHATHGTISAAIAIVTLAAGFGHAQIVQPDSAPSSPMTNQKLDVLIKKQFPADSINGALGFWRVELTQIAKPKPDANGKPVEEPDAAENAEQGPGAEDHLPPVLLVVTDESADRMRVMIPIRQFSPDREEDLQLALIALYANYDRALDARYAIHDGVLWSAFIHPLGSLTPADFENALNQVQALRDNTGTTYSSSDLMFGPGMREEDQPKPPAESEDEDKVV